MCNCALAYKQLSSVSDKFLMRDIFSNMAKESE